MIFLLGPFRATNVNLAANDLVAGLPSPMAALGFVGALAHRAGSHDWHHAVLPIYHQIQLSEGRTKATPERAAGGALENIELVEDLTGYVEFSLLADFPDGVNRNFLQGSLAGIRFAGGTVFPLKRGGNFLDCVTEASSVRDGILKVNPGYALTPPVGREDAGCVSFGESETLDTLHERLWARGRQKGEGWLVPAAVGLRLLEDATGTLGRPGVRDPAVPHVFCEPGAGIAELISTRNRSSWQHSSTETQRLWRWSCDHANRLVMFSEFHLEAAGGG